MPRRAICGCRRAAFPLEDRTTRLLPVLVITVSGAPALRGTVDWAIGSRMDLSPPNNASSPPKVRSLSTWIHRSASPSRI